MKLVEALTAIDELRENNNCSREQKIKWLSRLDMRIFGELIQTHRQEVPRTFTGYTPATPENTELLAPEPYDEVYLRYLESQIDYINADFDMFNASTVAFNDAYSDLAAWYNRTFTPLQTRLKYF